MFLKTVILLAILSYSSARSVRAARSDKIKVEVSKDIIEISYSRLRKGVDIVFEEDAAGHVVIELQVKTRGAGTTRYQIHDHEVNNAGDLQSEILTEVFENYQGDLDRDKYEDLLDDIDERVTDSEIDPIIFQVLSGLTNKDHIYNHNHSHINGCSQCHNHAGTHTHTWSFQGQTYPYGGQVVSTGPYTYVDDSALII